MEQIVSGLGLFVMLFLAWLCSENRWKMDWRLIITGLLLQVTLGVLLLGTKPGLMIFDASRHVLCGFLGCSNEGSRFVFGDAFEEHFMAFSVLPAIIVYSALTAILFYLGILQWIVKGFAWVMARVMNASGSESLCTTANIFVGMVVAPLMIKPYLKSMTRSELMVMMTGGMATAAGGTIAAYVGMGVDAGHMMVASIMSAPAAIVIAKIMLPETEESLTFRQVRVEVEMDDANVLDAACRGTSEGVQLVINVAAMLISFVALIHLVNWGLSFDWFYVGGEPLTLQRIAGWIFSPLALAIGIEWKDVHSVGMLLGEKTIFNEFIAYEHMIKIQDTLSPRSVAIATYAMCGFANFGSIAIMIGGIGSLIPTRRADLARLGIRSLIGGTLAALMTACVAGMLIPKG